MPPSMAIAVPVTISAASLTRYRIASATSSGVTIRPYARASGLALMIFCAAAAGSGSWARSVCMMAVSLTGPGHTQFTRIRSRECDSASDFVSPTSACLLVE